MAMGAAIAIMTRLHMPSITVEIKLKVTYASSPSTCYVTQTLSMVTALICEHNNKIQTFSMSLLNLLMILPVFVLSKYDMGDRSTPQRASL